MDEDRNTRDLKFMGVEFKNCPMDYHTWIFPVFVLETPLQGGLEGILKGNKGQGLKSTLKTPHYMQFLYIEY